MSISFQGIGVRDYNSYRLSYTSHGPNMKESLSAPADNYLAVSVERAFGLPFRNRHYEGIQDAKEVRDAIQHERGKVSRSLAIGQKWFDKMQNAEGIAAHSSIDLLA